MKASEIRSLRGPLLVLAAILIAAAIVLYYTDSTLEEVMAASAQQQNQLRDARTRLQKSGDEKDIIVRYVGNYRYLQQLGFVGDEQRINWLDGLRIANQEARLFGVDYQINTQQPYPYASELNPGQLTLSQSLMKVNVKLLHENDLLNFLHILAAQNVGVFAVNQCLLSRMEAANNTRVQPHLTADCELAWITMKPNNPGDKKS
jgi:hypothetical protein